MTDRRENGINGYDVGAEEIITGSDTDDDTNSDSSSEGDSEGD